MAVGEETAQTVLSVSSKATMLTAEVIFTLMRTLLNHLRTNNVQQFSAAQNRAQVAQNKAQAKTGKQSLKELSSKNVTIDSVPVSNVDIKAISSRLKQMGVDFAVTKSRNTGEFNLFFKATDTTVITAAFEEVITDKDKNKRSDKSEEKTGDKKPIDEQVKDAQDKADAQNKAKAAEKAQEQQKHKSRSGREQDR